MSWSCPDREPPRIRRTAGAAAVAASASLCAWTLLASVRPVHAAEYYYQPIATLTADVNSNLDLDPDTKQWVEGYLADLATLFGVTTANSNTVLKPRLTYRYYPKETDDDRLEGYLDLNSSYRTQRSNASITGSVQHQDEFNAEFTPASYNPVNPNQPIPDTGKAVLGATRDSVILYPKYTYNLTPLIGVGASGVYQKVNYTPTDPSYHADFYDYLARGFVGFTLDPKTDLDVGAYTSQYEATHFESRAIGTGGTLDLYDEWTPLFSTDEGVVFQHTSINAVLPVPLVTTVNTWGAHAAVNYKTLVDQYRFNIERSIAPSGGAGVYVNEKLQFQYDRNVTSRFSVSGALVGLRTRALTENASLADRSYAQTIAEARYMLAPTWFVQGGALYAWQKYTFLEHADNTRVYIQIGYQGLGPQR